MLSDNELNQLLLKNRHSDEACRLIRHIRATPPSRRVSSGHQSVSARFPSRKMGLTIQAESHTNELAAVYLWEHDATVHEFYDQPPQIRLAYKNANGKTVGFYHTPDFFLLADDFIGWVECKTEEELHRLAEKHPQRFQQRDGVWVSPPGEEFAAQYGLRYAIRSSAATDWTLLGNLLTLQDYLDPACPSPSGEQREVVSALFKEQAWMRLIDLVRTDDKLPADAVYKFIVDGTLYVDLLRTPLSDLEHAVVFRDQAAAQAHSLLGTPERQPIDQPLSLEVGEHLFWEGVSWTIAHPGRDLVQIVNEQGRLISLARQELEQLASEGAVKGATEVALPAGRKEAEALMSHASPDELTQATERIRLLSPEDYGPPTITRSARTIRNYRSRYLEAEAAHGIGFVGLLPQTHKRGNREAKVESGVIELVHKILEDIYLQPQRPTLRVAYGELRNRCKEDGLLPPSEKTFRTKAKTYRAHMKELVRGGKRAAYALEDAIWHSSGGLPRHGDRPFDVTHIDHTQIDLSVIDQRYGTELGRPWLSVLIDAYSRHVLAYYLSFDPPSSVSCMMLMRRCVQKHGRMPRSLVVDGGKEFGSTYFEQLLAQYECTKKTRPAAEPRFGSVMERLFGVINKDLWHNLKGNTQAIRNPRSMSASHDPARHTVWTLRDIDAAFQDWLETTYHQSPHSTLNTTPALAFETGKADYGYRSHKLIPYTPGFILSSLPEAKGGPRKMHVGRGVKIGQIYYWHEAFRSAHVEGAQLAVRYDPLDASRAYAYVNREWVCCRPANYKLFEHRTEREVELAAAQARALHKADYQNSHRRCELVAEFLADMRLQEEELANRREANQSAVIALPAPEPAPPVSEAVPQLDVYGDF